MTVLENGRDIGASPADQHFIYYGNYHFTIIANGYETLQVDQCIPRPWYQYFPSGATINSVLMKNYQCASDTRSNLSCNDGGNLNAQISYRAADKTRSPLARGPFPPSACGAAVRPLRRLHDAVRW